MVFTMFIISDTIQVRTITVKIIPLQSGGTLSQRAKLTGGQLQAQSSIQWKDDHRDLFTLDDGITIPPFTGGPFQGSDCVNTDKGYKKKHFNGYTLQTIKASMYQSMIQGIPAIKKLKLYNFESWLDLHQDTLDLASSTRLTT